MKKTKILVCMALSLLMMFACAIPAFAVNTEVKYKVQGEKVVTGAGAPATEFEFILTPGKAFASVKVAEQKDGTSYTMYDNEIENPLKSAIRTQATVAATTQATPKKAASFAFTDLTFTKPGYYFYTVTEAQDPTPSEDGTWNYSKAKYTIMIQVTYDNDGNLIAAPIVWRETTHTDITDGEKYSHKEDEDKILTDGNLILLFKNVYTETDKSTHLKVSKTVTGNMGDKTKDFEFTVKKVDGEKSMQKYNSSGEKVGDSFMVKTGSTFTLKNGEYVIISGLDIGKSITVEETECKPYIQSVKVTDANWNEDNKNLREWQVALKEGENILAYTNNYVAPAIVGSMMATIPFVLLITLAAGGIAMLIIKKRKAIAE